MKKLIFTDPHITDSSIKELEDIFQEILTYNAEQMIMIGDWYDKNKPSPAELLFGTKWACGFQKKYKKVVFLRGNHDQLNSANAIDYLQYFGIQIVDDYVTKSNVFFSHCMLHTSMLAYGTGKYGIKDLAKYKYAFLGHQHNYQKLAKNIYHPGSCRYQNFNESTDKNKYIVILEDYKLQFIPLKSPIKMFDFTSLEELEKADTNIKARLIFSSFDQFKKSINELHKYKSKFHTFKVKLNFEKEVESVEKADTSNKKLEEILEDGIARVKDKQVRDLLKEALK